MFKVIFSILMTTSLLSNAFEEQTPWKKETAQGFTVYNDQLETTEGFGSYLDFCLKPNTRNFDNGGGSHNYNSLFLKDYLGVTNVVYDPFQRPEQENLIALTEASKHNFDTSTSNSVLNVIDHKESRKKHIMLCCEALKNGGIAYFKVYPGDNSQKEQWFENSYQSNLSAKAYQEEVEEVFGKGNVVTNVERHMIIAYKNSDCQKM